MTPASLPNEPPLLEVRDLRTAFHTPRGVVRAVDGVSFTLERGCTMGIVGESGSGKSVLLRTIMGLVGGPGVEVSGSVRLDGEELVGRSPAELRAIWGTSIAMVFQDPMTSLNPVMKIGPQITESLRMKLGLDRQNANATALQLLQAVGIASPERRMQEYPHQMSGGMRQRVVIAAALACGPRVLLADEPTTALDVTVQAQILDLLAEQQADRNMSVILVTHDLGVVAGRVSDVAVMYAGKVVERAATKSLFAQMRMPYTEALLGSIPRLDRPPHSRLLAIPGRPPDLLTPPAGCSFAPRCRYAAPKCVEEAPPLEEIDPAHEVACWYPVRTPADGDTLPADVPVPFPS